MIRKLALALFCLAVVSVPASAQQTENFSRKVRLGANGRVTVSNIAGDITVSPGAGDEVSIEAVKRTTGARSDLAQVQIQVDEHPGRVDITTNYPNRFFGFSGPGVAVDYTLTVPATAAVEAKSISGRVRVTGVRGSVSTETVSGAIVVSGAPGLDRAKSVSGSVDLSDVGNAGDLEINTVSGGIRLARLKSKMLDLHTISGSMDLSDVGSDHLIAHSISGDLQFNGTLARNGRYEVHSHSGTVTFTLPANAGFDFDARSFSGDIRSAFQMTVGGDVNQSIRTQNRGPGRGSLRATVGDGSAELSIDTFSGSIILNKR